MKMLALLSKSTSRIFLFYFCFGTPFSRAYYLRDPSALNKDVNLLENIECFKGF